LAVNQSLVRSFNTSFIALLPVGAIQSHGGAGVSQDTPLAGMYAGIRTLRIVDGPDEVHIRDVARLEIKPYLS